MEKYMSSSPITSLEIKACVFQTLSLYIQLLCFTLEDEYDNMCTCTVGSYMYTHHYSTHVVSLDLLGIKDTLQKSKLQLWCGLQPVSDL